MRRLGPILLAVWALLMGAAFVVLDPEQALRPEAAQAGGLGLIVAIAWTVAALGAGGAVLRRWAPALLEDERGVAHALVVGVLLWSLGALGVASLGLLGRPALLVLGLALSAGWLTRPRLRWPRPSPAVWLALIAVGVPGLIESMAPPTDTDALYYHLALPLKMLDHGGLVGGILDPSGHRPLVLHLPLASLLAFGGEAAPRLFHLVLGLGVVTFTAQIGERRLGEDAGAAAALLLAGSWSFVHGAGVVGSETLAALAVLAALDAGLRGSSRGLALAAGVALSVKYTTAGAIVGVFLVAAVPWAARVVAGVGALALLVPWWSRNLIAGQHPLFPFAGWPPVLPFQYLEKYGAGRGVVDFLLLPWRVVASADTTSFRFLGKLTPALLALAPAAIPAWIRKGDARRVAVAALVGAIAWALGPQLLRYLVPTLPVLALAVGAGAVTLLQGGPVGRVGLAAVLAAGLAGVPSNLGPIARSAGDRVLAATGIESRDAFLDRQLPGWAATRWANEHLPPDARVALLFSWQGYLLEREAVMGSVEDHVPVRHWILQNGPDSLSALRAAGVTHILVRKQRFLRKSYPFVNDEDFQRLFRAPVEALDELLLMEATLLMEADGARVYRLSPDPREGSNP
jgi:hypothetical protein